MLLLVRRASPPLMSSQMTLFSEKTIVQLSSVRQLPTVTGQGKSFVSISAEFLLEQSIIAKSVEHSVRTVFAI